ncbi:hypothetical protein [Methanogenium cariaci]|uniref:hypothetical protein n=1 Tax=Methanogenium cariaci TaxID=2197 RepID=UPI000785EA41|nr:hypothetical protein [Methanogenium cariaci]
MTRHSVYIWRRYPTYVPHSDRRPTPSAGGACQTGGEEAVRHGCEYGGEITAGFVCTTAEEEATGLPMHAMLTPPAAISTLYGEGNRLPDGIRYILNTETSFPHTDRFGIRHPAAVLRWDDRVWLTEFVEMLVFISDHLGQPADAIVLHPGKAHGMTFSAMARAMRYIRDAYANACTRMPAVLMQNGYPLADTVGKRYPGLLAHHAGAGAGMLRYLRCAPRPLRPRHRRPPCKSSPLHIPCAHPCRRPEGLLFAARG